MAVFPSEGGGGKYLHNHVPTWFLWTLAAAVLLGVSDAFANYVTGEVQHWTGILIRFGLVFGPAAIILGAILHKIPYTRKLGIEFMIGGFVGLMVILVFPVAWPHIQTLVAAKAPGILDQLFSALGTS